MNILSRLYQKYIVAERVPIDFMESELKLPYTYAVVRSDLPLVHQGVQLGHAVQRATMRLIPKDASDGYLIYLEVKNKEDLEMLMEKLGMKQIPFEAFYEPDYDRGLIAFATGLITENRHRKAFEGLPRWMSSRADEN